MPRFVDASVFVHAYLRPRRELKPHERRIKAQARTIVARVNEGEAVVTSAVHFSEVANILEAWMRFDAAQAVQRGLCARETVEILSVARGDLLEALSTGSEVGVGTTFHIYLPASRKLSGEEEASVPKALPRHGRILVMDDEEGVREPFGLTLQQMGHEVELAKDGETAIEVYERAKGVGRPFDVVILGLTVRGGMGGQEAIRALLRIDPTVKAIVTSGYANDPVVLEHERHGFKGALKKPFNTGELQEIVFRVMGS